MKRFFSKLIFNRINIKILSVCAVFGVQAFDLPVFYRAPFLQPEATQKTQNWTTVLLARVGYGSTSDSFNQSEDKTALFNDYGPFDLTRLGIGIEGLGVGGDKPVTTSYWGPGAVWANPPNNGNDSNFAYPKGRVEFSGRFTTTEGNLIWQQNLLWGFYTHLYIPYKDLKITNITPKNVGPAQVAGENMNDFITNDLPTILKENGLNITTKVVGGVKVDALETSFKKNGIGDIAFSLGWHGYKQKLCGVISSCGGFVQSGVLIPVAAKQDPNSIFSLPLGYNEHWGVVSRLAFEAEIWEMFSIGLQAGSLIFFKNDRDLYLKTDKLQTGWILLQKAHVKEDLGSMWDAGAYVKANLMVKGFDVLVGYSFSKQDRTILQVRDDNYLKTALQNLANQLNTPTLAPVHIGTDGPNIIFISQDDYANSDVRQGGWEIQTIHFMMRYDMSAATKGCWGPLFQIEYNYPMWGKHSWATDIFAGTLGFTVSFNF